MLFTLITSSTGPATKIFSLLGDGALHKVSSGNIYAGEVRTMRVASLDTFIAIRAQLRPNQALVYGVCGKSRAKLSTKDSPSVKLGDAIARSQAHFRFHDGPSIFFADYDPQPGRRLLSWRDLDTIYCSVLPALAGTARAWVPSSSAYLYRRDDGAELIGSGGWRLYCAVDNGRTIPDLMATIYQGLWAAGHGFVDYEIDGGRHEYALIDPCTAQPERLDFCAPPILRCGLVRKAPAPVMLDGAPMLRGIVPVMPMAEWRRSDPVRNAAWAAALPESKRRKAKFKGERIEGDVAAGVPRAKAERRWSAAVDGGRLNDDFIVILTDGTQISVGELLADPQQWNLATCHDPMAPNSDRDDPRVAQVYAYDRRLHSFLYDKTYRLGSTRSEKLWPAAKAVLDRPAPEPSPAMRELLAISERRRKK